MVLLKYFCDAPILKPFYETQFLLTLSVPVDVFGYNNHATEKYSIVYNLNLW